MKEFFKDLKDNLFDILKKFAVRLLIGTIAVVLLAKLTNQTAGNLCFFVCVVASYLAWRQFTAQRGMGLRFTKPGDYTSSLITDSNVRDNFSHSHQASIESSDWDAMIAYVLTALVFLTAALLFWMI